MSQIDALKFMIEFFDQNPRKISPPPESGCIKKDEFLKKIYLDIKKDIDELYTINDMLSDESSDSYHGFLLLSKNSVKRLKTINERIQEYEELLEKEDPIHIFKLKQIAKDYANPM